MKQRHLTVMKVGGELLESAGDLRHIVNHIRSAASDPLVVVHGGGRELSAELARRGATSAMVDGIRITDEDALAAAVSVLGGTINTRLVAAAGAAGIRAVGLTGVDGAVLRARRSAARRSHSGAMVDLGHVGDPIAPGDPMLLQHLCSQGWVPIVASIGVAADGSVLNVNADVAACHLALALRAKCLLVLGATDGVFGSDGATVSTLSQAHAEALIQGGTARDGMAAKLEACTRATAGGVEEVRIVNGRAASLNAGGTRIVPGGIARAS